jgi:hypothetical protein
MQVETATSTFSCSGDHIQLRDKCFGLYLIDEQ